MSTTDKIKQLSEARATVANLEQTIAAELHSELAALPAQYGFASTADFVAAVTTAAGKRPDRKPGKATAEAPAKRASKKGHRASRRSMI